MPDEVAVTGFGATTPLGGDVRATWEALLAGRSGVTTLDEEWVRRLALPTRIAARLAVEPAELLSAVQRRRLDRCSQVALIAAREACRHAGLDGDAVDRDRLAVVVGTGIGSARTLLDQHDLLTGQGLRKVSPRMVSMTMPNSPAATVGLDLHARGGVHAPVSACASGAEALAWAWRLLRAGEVDVVVAGGAEAAVHEVTIAGFSQARSLSVRNAEPGRASRPFDADRDGFVLGEGAGILVLERAAHAAARGATVHAVLAGAGTTADGYHITAPDPAGLGQARAIRAALRTGGLDPGDIGHVNCHATATPVGDVTESVAIDLVLGGHPLLTAPKGALGHLLGAAGAVEAILTVLSLRDGVVPATLNLDHPDPGLRHEVVTGTPRRLAPEPAVTDSFGFGGHNVALAFVPA